MSRSYSTISSNLLKFLFLRSYLIIHYKLKNKILNSKLRLQCSYATLPCKSPFSRNIKNNKWHCDFDNIKTYHKSYSNIQEKKKDFLLNKIWKFEAFNAKWHYYNAYQNTVIVLCLAMFQISQADIFTKIYTRWSSNWFSEMINVMEIIYHFYSFFI